MLTTTILVALGILLLYVLAQMRKTPGSPAAKQVASPPPAALPASTAPDLASARPGDVLSIHGAAEDFSDLDVTLDRRSAYKTGPRRWLDLSGEYRGRRIYLEVHTGSELEVMGLLDPRRLTLADLGVTEEQLAAFDQQQNPASSFAFEGKRWNYESSRELGYLENEQGQGEGLYRWLFREQDGQRLLCIEKWEGEPFDVRIAQKLNPQDITVYRAA